jgi:putative transposase
MPKQTFTTEKIIHKLREAEVMSGQGKTVAEVCKQLGITDKTYFRWRKRHGGLRIDQAKRMKELETENARLSGAGGSEAVYGGRSRSHSYCARNDLANFLSCRRISQSRPEPSFCLTSRPERYIAQHSPRPAWSQFGSNVIAICTSGARPKTRGYRQPKLNFGFLRLQRIAICEGDFYPIDFMVVREGLEPSTSAL